MARLFIGVWLDPLLREAVVNWKQAAACDSKGWKWTAPEQLHFTMKFLGEVERCRIKDLQQKMAEIAEQNQVFELSLDRAGYFPNAQNPRIFWLGVSKGSKELVQLANTIEMACRKIGFAAEEKVFQSHLTLARSRPNATLHLEPPLTQPPVTNMSVGSFCLIESILRTTGPSYHTVAEFPLKNA